MEPWKPWDATDEEYAELQVIREPIPDSLIGTIDRWLYEYFSARSSYNEVEASLTNTLEAAFRIPLPTEVHPQTLTEAIREEGDKYTLRVIDLLLSLRPSDPMGRAPTDVAFLSSQMDLSSSAVKVVRATHGNGYRLAPRLAEGVEEGAQRAINDANPTAGRHLATAWREMQSLTPDASKILREGIQAVEAAAGPVVIPNDKRPQLSKIVGALRDQQGWGLVLARRDDGHPDHKSVLIGMLETLAFAEQHRHSGHGYSETEAVGHVELAATLVGWFSGGVVARSQ